MPKCATGLDLFPWLLMTDSARLLLRFAVRAPICLAYHAESARLDDMWWEKREEKSEIWRKCMRCVKWQEGIVEPCDRGGFGGWRAVAESVVYLEREGGADISNRETWRGRQQRRGGLTLVKVRDTCLLPLIVTQAATALTSSWRTDYEEAVATATALVAMEIVMCERSVSRTQTEGSRPNRIVPSHDLCDRWLCRASETRHLSVKIKNDMKEERENVQEQSAGIMYSFNHIRACTARTCRTVLRDFHSRCMEKNTYKHATSLQHINARQSRCKSTDLWYWTVCSQKEEAWFIIDFSHPLVNEARLRVIIYFLIFDSQLGFVVMYQYKWNLKHNVILSEGLSVWSNISEICLYVATRLEITLSLFLSVLPSVQEDVEQGAVPFVRDESLREPGVRIHLHYLSR